MKLIKCKCGVEVMLDDNVYERLPTHRVFCSNEGRTVRLKGFGATRISHFVIQNCPEGFVRDHIDRNPHNNLASNLRVVTNAQHCANRNVQKNNTTSVKNVSF